MNPKSITIDGVEYAPTQSSGENTLTHRITLDQILSAFQSYTRKVRAAGTETVAFAGDLSDTVDEIVEHGVDDHALSALDYTLFAILAETYRRGMATR